MAIKIGDINPAKIPHEVPQTERRTAEAPQASFRSQLVDINGQNYMEKLAALGDKITEQGELLKKRTDIVELKRYKALVGDYMRAALDYSMKFNKEQTFDARGRHRTFVTVQKIDSKLQDLTDEILKEQADSIKVMDAIDDIRGLLIDLTV
ncbi:YaaR family protein [Oscillospiraceae bacterium OttesenSCG-928-F05]|nr:YaaR family protein [Oscillospiraceae bacterium OttesenSCG-928-F05]